MKTTQAKNLMRAMLLAFSLILAPLAAETLAQNTSTTQSGQSAQSGATTQSSRQTTTTTQSQPATTSNQTTTTTTTRPAETTQTSAQNRNGIDPMWIVIGIVALLAILLIAILSMRGRSRGGSDTTYERKTTVKRE